MAEEYTYTRYANAFNSTEFTNCCGLAVIKPAYWLGDEADPVRCSGCRKRVSFMGRPPYSPNCRMCGRPRNACYC